MMLLRLAWKSLRARRVTTALTVFSIALSMLLLAGVDAVRNGMHTGFAGTISKTDLIVGARGGDLPLLLSTVFHIGNASNNIAWESYRHFAHHPAVAWTIPLSMGDSFHGYRVIATDENLYRHYRYRGGQSLQFAQGAAPAALLDAALGAEVADRLHLQPGRKLTLSHGMQEHSILQHDNVAFTVTGILQRTGTPIDDAVYVTLLGEEAMHFGWTDGTPPAIGEAAPVLDPSKLKVDQITAFLLAGKSRISTLYLQREIDTYKPEPLTAIIPAYTLQQLWALMDYADAALSLISAAVLMVGLLSMVAALYTALNERRREIAILRSIGLRARQIFGLFVAESAIIAVAGTALGLAALYTVLLGFHAAVERAAGVPLPVTAPSHRVQLYALAVIGLGALLGVIPGWRAYRTSLVDGLHAP